ncbi:NUDIX domain-containing protein [Janibacter sp. GXQ6167]|uniref:NUDIX hydrolase n=1 Tax=Janibacter sp. GXQ6167 TaxID=3240791 RepID=UPI0035240584
MATVLAAGTLPWRRRRGELQVALVHRPQYRDWSWAKGKLDRGEIFPVAAARETAEETGLEVRLGRPLPTSTYALRDRNGRPSIKDVRYWAAEVVGGHGRLEHEIDEVAWLSAEEAAWRLTYQRDQEQLLALANADRQGSLTTWPLAIVRHAKAHPRARWSDDDWLRPLDARGREQAQDLVPLLAAYGIERLVSSPSVRATETLAPYAKKLGAEMKLKKGLSEEGFAADPTKAAHHLRRIVERGQPTALCSHGPVLPDLVALLLLLVDERYQQGQVAQSVIEHALLKGITKGEALIVHVAGTGASARIVAAERHHPLDRA